MSGPGKVSTAAKGPHRHIGKQPTHIKPTAGKTIPLRLTGGKKMIFQVSTPPLHGSAAPGTPPTHAKRFPSGYSGPAIDAISNASLKRLARRGGTKRISQSIYREMRGVLETFLSSVIRDAVTYCEHARRKTVTSLDVVYALRRQGRTLYGFGA